MQKDQADGARGKAALEFFNWAYTSGADAAASLDYVAIPAKVYKLVQSQVWPSITVSGTPVWP
jgi:phosphate transport system substrate-binding protein